MALLTEIWVTDIQEKLTENLGYLNMSVDESSFATPLASGRYAVHRPMAGTMPSVEKNRAVLPAQIEKRTDTDEVYYVNDYTTAPMLVSQLETYQISYDKRQSILRESLNRISERMAYDALVEWAATVSGKIVRTSGASTGALPPSGTGTRKKAAIADVAKLATIFDKDKVPANGRVLALPPDLYEDLATQSDVLSSFISGKTVYPDGQLPRVYGFEVMKIVDLPIYTTALAVRPFGESGAAADNFAGLAWHRDFVAKAMLAPQIFESSRQPEYYGDLVSMMAYMGAAKVRPTTQVGVGALVQAAG